MLYLHKELEASQVGENRVRARVALNRPKAPYTTTDHHKPPKTFSWAFLLKSSKVSCVFAIAKEGLGSKIQKVDKTHGGPNPVWLKQAPWPKSLG